MTKHTRSSYKIRHIPIKRIFDILFSFCILVLISPLFLLLSTLIYFTSPGKVIYSHERVGRGGKTFRCYKFSTMYSDAEERLKDILRNDPAKRKEWQTNFKLKDDPRITPIGKILRKTSMDELPQFWNVLKGDLSIVGPRPVIIQEVQTRFGTKAYKILSVRPGITGLWQVSGRNDISYAKRIQLDEQYIDQRSMFMDIKLIAKTIPAILTSKGAY